MITKLKRDFEVECLTGASTYMFDLALVHKESGEKVLIRWDGEMKVSLDTFRDLTATYSIHYSKWRLDDRLQALK